MCVCVCVRSCVRACVRACVCVIIMQRLTHHVSVIRMTNRRCGAICGLAILLFVWWFVCSNDNDRTDDKLSDNSADEAEHPKYTV